MINLPRRNVLIGFGGCAIGALLPFAAYAEDLTDVEPQPYFASVKRAVEAFATAGQPIAKADADKLAELAAKGDPDAVSAAEVILDRYTLARVTLDKDGVGTATPGGAERTLTEQGWKSFLVRVYNPIGHLEELGIFTGWSTPGSTPGHMDPFATIASAQRGSISGPLINAPSLEKMWILGQALANSKLNGAAV